MEESTNGAKLWKITYCAANSWPYCRCNDRCLSKPVPSHFERCLGPIAPAIPIEKPNYKIPTPILKKNISISATHREEECSHPKHIVVIMPYVTATHVPKVLGWQQLVTTTSHIDLNLEGDFAELPPYLHPLV